MIALVLQILLLIGFAVMLVNVVGIARSLRAISKTLSESQITQLRIQQNTAEKRAEQFEEA